MEELFYWMFYISPQIQNTVKSTGYPPRDYLLWKAFQRRYTGGGGVNMNSEKQQQQQQQQQQQTPKS